MKTQSKQDGVPNHHFTNFYNPVSPINQQKSQITISPTFLTPFYHLTNQKNPKSPLLLGQITNNRKYLPPPPIINGTEISAILH